MPFGQWEGWIKANSECAFSERQAQKFMLVATNKLLVLEYFSDENSVNQLTKAIAEATPEQLARVAQIGRKNSDLTLSTRARIFYIKAAYTRKKWAPKRAPNAKTH